MINHIAIEDEQEYFESSLESSYSGMMMIPNEKLDKSRLAFTEALMINHFLTEGAQEGLIQSIKNFFTKLILSFKEYIKELQLKIEYTIREKQLKSQLEGLREEFKNNPAKANEPIEILDFWGYEKLYKELNNKLEKYAKKFAKIKYTKTYQIEDDIQTFNNIINDYGTKMEAASRAKVTVPKIKAVNFIEDEIRGKSEILKSLNDNMRHFQEMQQLAESLQTKMNILGADVIPKHVGFIQKIANAVSGFVRKWVTKFIMTVVFLFA